MTLRGGGESKKEDQKDPASEVKGEKGKDEKKEEEEPTLVRHPPLLPRRGNATTTVVRRLWHKSAEQGHATPGLVVDVLGGSTSSLASVAARPRSGGGM